MKRLLIPCVLLSVLGAAILVTAQCATSGLALKQKATTALQVSAVTLHDLRVTELAFYTAKTVPSYTAQKHLAFLDVLDKAQVAEAATAKGLLAWNPADITSAPATASDYVKFAQAMVTIAQATGIPATHDFLVTAQKVLAQAQATLTLINGGKA